MNTEQETVDTTRVVAGRKEAAALGHAANALGNNYRVISVEDDGSKYVHLEVTEPEKGVLGRPLYDKADEILKEDEKN